MRPLTLAVALCLSLSLVAQDPVLRIVPADGARTLVAAASGAEAAIRTTGAEIRDPRLVTTPGSAALAATWTEVGATGTAESFAAVSLDGKRWSEAAPDAYDLLLRYARFDPLQGEPPLPAGLDGQAGGRLWIVQWAAQGLEPWRDAVRALGGTVHLHLEWHANVVEMDAATAAQVMGLPFVRWVGPFHPAYRIEEELLPAALAPGDAALPLRVNILAIRRGPEGQGPVAAAVEALGGRVESVFDPTYLVTATVPAAALAALARLDAVQWIDRAGVPEEDMDIARSVHGANYVETAGGYTGQNVRVEVMDGGCDTSHPDFAGRVTVHTTNVTGDHGTCTTGIVGGSGAGNAAARGVMPSAHLVVGYYNSFAGGSRYNHTAELQNDALSYKAVLQSNSWGSSLTTAYNSTSQNMDLILFDHQRISILNSQSNAGTQSSRPEAWAKNVISVGGIRHYNTASTTDDAWASGASIGPAADGRLKPDVASFYDSTLCTDIVGTSGYSTTNYYSSFGGTSGATPITAGHLGLLYQMWSDGVFGNSAPGATPYDDRPKNTTAKALLINTASQWTFSGTTHDLTRTHQGWGRANLQTAWDLRTQMYIVDETDVLANLGSTTHSVSVSAGTPAFKATMVYRDPPGTTSSTLHRINNLDLTVTSPSGTVYRGNNGLAAGMWSTAGGSANNVDTVENVFVQNPEAGTWLVQVAASAVNQDSHVETGVVDADYALVVSGVGLAAPPTPPAAPTGLTANAVSSSQINLTWADNSGNETGFEVDRSTDGVNFAQIATTGANVTTYASTGLAASTTYWYRVRATNGAGDSGDSNIASATTPAPGPADDRAIADLPVQGTVTGTYTNTHSANNVYQTIKEIVTGTGNNRISQLEHKWTFNVTGGASVTFNVQAHHTSNTENDHFVFAYSTNGTTFTDMVTVTATADPGTWLSFALPGATSGTVTIRIRDTDRTPGRRKTDTLSVDDMYIRSQ